MKSDTPKIWHLLEIHVEHNALEAIEFAFNELDSLGSETDQFHRSPSDPLWIKGYFESLPDKQTVEDVISEALNIYGLTRSVILEQTWSEIYETDWLAVWKEHWKPTVIGNFIVAPPWEKPDPGDKLAILIEPNMAFGTGTHETTQLCLRALGDHLHASDSFIDVGTGTGILAIGAALLKLDSGHAAAGEIYACDTDPTSVDLARENAELNGVGGLIDFFCGTITPQTPVADLVCANLTLDVILSMLDLLLSKTRRILILSGILAEQERAIRDALAERSVIAPKVETAGEWISVIVEK